MFVPPNSRRRLVLLHGCPRRVELFDGFRMSVCLDSGNEPVKRIAGRHAPPPWCVVILSGDTLRTVILFAPSAPAVQIFILTMRTFDRGQLIIEIRQRFAAR